MITLLWLLLFYPGFTNPDVHTLQINVDDIRNEEGVVRIAVYRPNDKFLGKEPYKKYEFRPSVPSIQVEIDLPKGRYGIGVMHDEDKDEQLDKNFFGLPKEGYGVSRNVAKGLSRPAFKDAEIVVEKTTRINIDLVHW